MAKKRYRVSSGKAGYWSQPDPLVKEMEVELEKIFDSRKSEVDSTRIPDVDFLVNSFVPDVVEFRRISLGLAGEREEQLRSAILARIDLDERVGVEFGFSFETLRAITKAIAEKTTTLQEVMSWKEKFARKSQEELEEG